MLYLIIVSLIWAFSFGLIKGNLAGLNANFVACSRMFVSTLVFFPFLKLSAINFRLKLNLIFIGSIQFGLMYIFYLSAYKYLMAYEIALFTILTPIFVSLIDNLFERRFSLINFNCAFLAVFAAAIIRYNNPLSTVFIGFFLMQLSNICFAFGQVYYKRILKNTDDKNIFALLYFGAF